MLVRFLHENGKPVTQSWIVRQAFPNATVIDQAHRGVGLWMLPEGSPSSGEKTVVVEPPFLGQRGQSERIQWATYVRGGVQR
jgi:hypothetical protein